MRMIHRKTKPMIRRSWKMNPMIRSEHLNRVCPGKFFVKFKWIKFILFKIQFRCFVYPRVIRRFRRHQRN